MSFASPAKFGTSTSARPAPSAEGPEARTLLVGKGISLQGTVTDAERLVVEGTVESKAIRATELAVAHTGVFRGEVEVARAEIAGLFDGTITVRGNVTVRATGTMKGAVRYRTLIVEDGGALFASLEILPDDS